MLLRIGLAQDTPHDLLHVNGGGLVGKRRQYIRKRTVPALLQSIDGDDIADGAVPAHQVDFAQLIHLGGLDGDLLFRDAHVHKHGFYFVKCLAVLACFRLRLEQYDGTDVLAALLRRRRRLPLDAAAKLDGVLYHALPGGAVVNHDGQLHHVFLFQLSGVYIADDVAVAPRRGGQVEHKGRIQIVEHFHAQIGTGVMAFIHDDHGRQMAQHLNERRVRRISQQHGIVVEILGKGKQVAVLLIDLANILFLAVHTQGIIAENTDSQHFSDGFG